MRFGGGDSFLGTDVEEFVPVVQAFAQNIQRLRSTIIFPCFAIQFSCQIERFNAIAELELHGSLSRQVMKYQDVKGEIALRVQQLYSESAAEEAKIDSDAFDKEVKARIVDSFNRLNLVSLSPAPQVTLGVEGMLSSLVIGAWSSFETMAADLWEVALNRHPKTLAELKGKSKRLLKGGEETTKAREVRLEVQQGKQVPLNLIQRYQYDLKSNMGTIHRERFSFDRLSGIREAYATAFESKTEKIDHALSSDSFDALSAVRNVLVHKAGKVDDEYAKKAQQFKLPSAERGQPLLLDGDTVVSLIEPVIANSISLIHAVGEWILKN